MNNRRVEQYSSYINDYYKPYKGAYTGVINLKSDENKLYAISNSFGIVYPVYYGINMDIFGKTVYLYNFVGSNSPYGAAKLYKTDTTNHLPGDYPVSLGRVQVGISISSPTYYIDNESSSTAFIFYIIGNSIYWMINTIFRIGDKWSENTSGHYTTSNAISDHYKYFNNYSIRKYASVIKTASSTRVRFFIIGNEGNSYFYIIIMEGTNTTEYRISYLDVKGYPYSNEGRVEHMGWLVLRRNDEKVIILVKSQDRSYGDTHAKFYYGLWTGNAKNNGESLLLTSEWECFYNIPSAITSVIGGDYWVSPDLKWLFYISLSGANYQGFSKGLHTIKGSSALFGENGWTGVSYEMEGGGTDILNACQNYYILDVQFNNKSNKIMVFGNSSKGAFTNVNSDYSYTEGIQPDIILYFIWVEGQKKFVKLNSSYIGGDTLWNDYSNSTSGGKGNIYKPLINFVNGEINFMYPGGNDPFNAYRYILSFGE